MPNRTRSRHGGCTCRQVRYQMISDPLIVHCCHWHGCQQNSGSAFALNAMIEANRVTLLSGKIEEIIVPTPGGTGQDIARCASCKVAVWSNYNLGGLCVNIFTSFALERLIFPTKCRLTFIFTYVPNSRGSICLKTRHSLTKSIISMRHGPNKP